MKKVSNKFTWKICGEAGFGVNSSGLLFSKLCARSGLYGFEYSEYPSLIRGGHQTSQVSVDVAPITSEHYSVDILVALNQQSVELHIDELSDHSALIFDSAQFQLKSIQDILGDKAKHTILLGMPLKMLSIKASKLNLMRNTVAIGATLGLLNYDTELMYSLLEDEFGDKSLEVVEMNKKAVQIGHDFVKENYNELVTTYYFQMERMPVEEKLMVVSGNESLGIGAIKGGVSFYSGYPMTPSSTLMAYMAAKQYEYGYVMKHAEDEIAVINMAIGASFAGARAMCATSGGGFSLMTEAIGLAAITETPITIVNVQRPGPATGLPTWTDQGDLRFALHAAQGEFLRVIIAPGDMEECYLAMQEALNLAEKYQIPAIVLSDKWLAESHMIVPHFKEDAVPIQRGKLALTDAGLNAANVLLPGEEYLRYMPTNSGVTLRTVPGVKDGVYLANSDEHDQKGYTSEESENRIEQVDKRMIKLHHVLRELADPKIYGDEHSSVLLVGWGSVKGPMLEALKMVEEEFDTSIAFVHIVNIWPFPKEYMATLLDKYRRVILVENNSHGQMGGLIQQMTGFHIHDKWLKYDGRPFWPEELKQKIIDVIEMRA
jgi:2-oxoglutarate/2-oxoacid ferredoxin oxidoreductase subunit alpha